MATIKTTIKRRNGTGWDELRPKTEVDQITDFDANVPDNLNDLTNVNAPSPSDGQALVWDNSTSKWVPGTVASTFNGGTITSNLTISNSSPRLILTDTNNDSDFHIQNWNGIFTVADTTNQEERFAITSDGKVGIGTTSPDEKLDVQGNAIVYGNLFVGGSDTDNFIAFRGTTGDGGTGQDTYRYNTTIIGEHIWGSTEKSELILFKGNDASTTSGEDRIRTISSEFRVDTYSSNTGYPDNTGQAAAYGTTRMIVTKTGNVGIGTTSPLSKLNITGTGNYPLTGSNGRYNYGQIHIDGTSSTSNDGHGITFAARDAIGVQAHITVSSDGSYGTKMSFGTTNSYSTGSSGKMVIDSGGNVGIGTTSPGEKLSISSGNIKLYSLQNVADQYRYIGTEYNNGNGNNKAEIRFAIDGADTKTRLQFHTANGAGNIDERMRITSTGKVGIGTTSPDTNLHILSANPILTIQDTETAGASSDARLRLAESTTNNVLDQYWDIKKEGTNLKFSEKYGTNVYDRFTISGANGNATFANDLTVQGDLFVSGSFTTIDTDTTTTEQWSVTNDGTGPAVIINQTGAQPIINIQDDGTSAFYIEDGGNVGIGTTTPSEKLDVLGSKIRLNSNSGGFYQYTTAGGFRSAFYDDGTSTRIFGDGDGGNAAITINGGNVGIGTTSPSEKLHIDGDVQIDGSGGTIGDTSSIANAWLKVGTSLGFDPNQILFSTSGYINATGSLSLGGGADGIGRTLYLGTDGNVGIGTTSPSEKLQVDGNIKLNSTLPKIQFTDTNNDSDFHIANNNGVLEIADTTNQASRVQIDSSGNVILPASGGLSLVDTAITNSSGALLWDGDEIYHEGHKPTLTELGAAASSHTHDDRYYTESEVQTFFNRGYISHHQASSLAVGWYTIATNTGDRALGQFQIWDTASGDHQSVVFNASHHFGVDGSNDITVLANSRYSGTNFRYIRIKDGGTYDGAALQVYIDGNTNDVHAAIVGYNAQESGWVLKDWIADATDPGDLSNYSSMGARVTVDLDKIVNGGILTSGLMYVSSDQRVFADDYHPNADKWTTARTITLGGDLSGSVSLDGSANVTLSAQVVNNSHTHDDRYVKLSGGNTISGNQNFYGTDTSGTYSSAAIEIREVNLVTTNQTSSAYAPGLAFHWGGRVQTQIKLHSDGNLNLSGNQTGRILTTADEGSGNGLDADTVDGIDSSRIVYGSNANKTTNVSSVSTALPSGIYDANNATGSPTSTWYTYLNMRHNNTANNYGGQLAMSFYDTQNVYVRNISNGTYGAWAKLWNSSNDGSGSGLDADTLDGVEASSFLRSDANDNFSGTLTYTGTGVAINTGGDNIDMGTMTIVGSNGVDGWANKPGIKLDSPNDFRIHASSGDATLYVDGEIYAGASAGSHKVFHDGYHPNADKWTTARTITLGGDLTGNVSIDGSANVTLSAQVANNSHSHSISNVSGLQAALDDKAEVTYTSGSTTTDVSTLNFALSGSTLTITTS